MKYLQLMGVDVWHFRTPNSYEYYRYDLFNFQNQKVGTLLADAVLKNKAEAQLVEKIAKATKKQFKGSLRSGLLESNELGKCVILLGSQVTRLISSLEQSQIIKSYSPSDLLQNTTLKVQTWNDLKAAMQLMQE
ncbi:hypothetical protein [Coxiella endosymbiont of Dermacentor marginatus]|uniref:hypothetical protein n=1 Tax=Coxiella endosymbiont of Dermacentor marginatus TaxID=1656159 RepID=UPI002223BEFC|nr:hypothetical protein [Coxiella endosymbiont of Dermacentor marginatus]